MTTAKYERRAEEFCSLLISEQFTNAAGLKPSIHTTAAFDGFRALFEREVVEELLSERGDPEGQRLAEFATFGRLNQRVSDLSDAIVTAETTKTVPWDGKALPLRRAAILLINEPDQQRRHELEGSLHEAVASVNSLRERRWEFLHEEAERLGFRSYRVLCDEIGQRQLEQLAQQARDLLAITADQYLLQLDVIAHRAGVPVEEATAADIAFLCRAQQFDRYFPDAELRPTLARTLRGIGITIESQRGLQIDLEDRPLKAPDGFCAPVRTPGDVRVVIPRTGGVWDYRALLHHVGCAEHFLNVRADVPFAFRRLGDQSLTIAFGCLLGGLTRDANWVRRVAGSMLPADFFDLAAFARLRLARAYAARLHYELELHDRAPLSEMPGRYVDHLRGALIHRVREVDYLATVDDTFHVADWLRGLVLETQLRQFLMREFREDWSSDHRSGEFLWYLWERGRTRSAEAVAREMGFDGLEPGRLIHDLTA